MIVCKLTVDNALASLVIVDKYKAGEEAGERRARQEDRMLRQEERISRQEDRMLRQEERIARQEERVPMQEERIARQEERVPRQEERMARQEVRVPRQEERMARQEEIHSMIYKEKLFRDGLKIPEGKK